jgi:cyclopropane fatty-acyl-phospholipid synthase-like methyltransferase
MDNEGGSIRQYYDDFSSEQVNTGLNLRHYYLINKIISSGLKKEHRVLEIGCGIGTLTSLLHKYLQRGKLVAADISPRSIELAKARIGQSSRIEFVVSDMHDFTYPEPFDYIILPDVLEHIPIDQHDNLFRVLRGVMHEGSMILIHIPHPKNIEFNRTFHPEKLQIIDQSLSADHLTNVIYPHGLALKTYESYRLFSDADDYVFMKVIVDKPINYKNLPVMNIIWKKFLLRVKWVFIRLDN